MGFIHWGNIFFKANNDNFIVKFRSSSPLNFLNLKFSRSSDQSIALHCTLIDWFLYNTNINFK